MVKPPQSFWEFFGEEETPMANIRYGMASDLRKGIGGRSCSVACKRENAVSLGGGRPWVSESKKGPDPHSRQSFLPLSGNICENPISVPVCPVGVSFRRNDGLALVDSHRCLRCGSGLAVYSWEAHNVNPRLNIIYLPKACALRAIRDESDKLPAIRPIRMVKPEMGLYPKGCIPAKANLDSIGSDKMGS